MDFDARAKLIQKASAIAMEDVALIPLHTPVQHFRRT